MATVASRPKGKFSIPSGRKALLRKPYQSVDTNIQSYDKTDPFLAFNVLRKLLGAMPSRIGGCQYKLSPDEHKLSMHLLTIVEPFVGLSPSRRTLTRQPNEILDSIVFHIDSKRDLLALALSCHRLHDIICPRHYNYRVIRCKVSSVSVWNHLLVHRSLARNVRRLHILDERSTEPELIPVGILISDTDLESTDDELSMHAKQERFLASALNRMTTLKSLSWSCNHSPISIGNVWPTILKCQSLQEVEINDNLIFGAYPQDADGSATKTCRPSKLRGLTTVALRSTKHVYGATKTPNLSRVSNMLDNCPNLESLNIGYDHRRGPGYLHPKADDLFMYSRWPQLRSLSLTNIRCSPTHGLDAAATFLCAHLNIEVLHLEIGECGSGGRPQLVLPDNSLPMLRELRANNSITTSIMLCPTGQTGPRPLETLKGIRLTGGAWDQPLLKSLKVGGHTVKRIEMVGWSDIEDVKKLTECVPKVAWLDLGKKLGVGTGGSSREIPPAANSLKAVNNSINTNVVDWANVLSALPDLTTFHGVKFFYEVSPLALAALASSSSTHSHSPASSGHLPASELSRVRKNENIASVLASKCTKLRRVDCWDDTAGKAVVFVREGGDLRLEVRRVKS